MALLPPPDISNAYVDEQNRPSKDFFNWIKSLYEYTRTLTGGVGSGVPGGALGQVQYNAGAGNFGGYTGTQVTALVDTFTVTLKGAVPPPGSVSGKVLGDNGLWVTMTGGGGGTPGGLNGQVQFNNAGAFGGYTDTQLTTHIDIFTASLKGAVPPGGSAPGTFLRFDGNWAVPAAGGGSSGYARAQRSITSGPATVLATDEILNYNIAAFPGGLTLPLASSRAGLPLTVKDVGGNFFNFPLVINPTGADLIEPPAGGSYIMRQANQATTFVPFNDGVNTGWFIL